MMKNSKAYLYCKSCVKKKTTPHYVALQMRDFMTICEGKDKRFVISGKKLKQLESILKLLRMPKGLKAGQTLFDCSVGYQWFLYTAVFCTVYRENESKRRYETAVLEIARKNFKTYTVATIFIILFLTEPNFSKFYSVAPDGALSREVREAIAETIRSSPSVYEFKTTKRFKILRDYIMFKPTQTQYIPLSYSTSRMDGRLPNVFVADEVGALPLSYPIDAMRSGQLNILNKLGFIISTKYPTIDNPLEDEVKYSKKVLDGLEKDESRFSLLYEPDSTKNWETDDLIMRQANPVSLEIPEIWEDLLKKRAYAIAVESARENFLCKHCNIIYAGTDSETFINVTDVQACRVAEIDWRGRTVYVGLDLSQTDDTSDFCRSLYEAAVAADADMAFGHISFDMPDGTSTVKYNPAVTDGPFEGPAKRAYLRKFKSYFTTYLYRRTLLMDNDIRFPDTHSAEDSCFLICSLLCARRIASAPEACYHYALQPGSVSQRRDPDRWRNRLASFRAVNAFARAHGLYRPYRSTLRLLTLKKGWLLAGRDFFQNNLFSIDL